ncbi:hypothetical protein CDAR_117551 [Caerostris darwini]|uniref:Uncharacterized protein n=1 Tax=Caerostris darwini TaxID=1538125 RepID=A0AAV4WL03_9ARAC|nr:hypothetical protein CDAR_117551 [Caerostris darwini]
MASVILPPYPVRAVVLYPFPGGGQVDSFSLFPFLFPVQSFYFQSCPEVRIPEKRRDCANDFSSKSPLGKEKRLIHASFCEKCPYLCGGSGQHLSGTPSEPELTNSPCKTARSLGR